MLMNPKAGTIAALVVTFFLLTINQTVQAQQIGASQPKQTKVSNSAAPRVKCRIVGAISHCCYRFDSDATWPEGLSDFHGSN